MKKFVCKVMAYLFVMLAILITVNTMYIKLDHSDSDNIDKFKSVPDRIEICNFGSSHGLYGYNYEDLEEKYCCFNFALSSQLLSYDYRILKYYQNQLKDGGVAFINVSFFSLFGVPETETDDFLSKNARYYKFLPKSLIKEYDPKVEFYSDKFPSLIAYGKLPKVLFGMCKNTSEIWSQTADTIDVNNDAENAFKRHIVTNKIDEDGERIYNDEEIAALYSIIELCKEINVTPILITTPFLKEYNDAVRDGDKEFYHDFYDLVNRVVEDTGVEYYDYSKDDRFVDDYSLFMNADHLNRFGARKFVGILAEEVLENGVELKK